jgi:glycosyltransferase involved in cell wall biosynthesis
MGTYNGEQFLQEQLDSIFGQTYPHWELLIRDDGSKDDTQKILKANHSLYPDRIKLVNDNEGNLGGFTQNFQRLCKLSSASIIAFADQDDVWKPEKMARSVEMLVDLEDKFGQETPLLVHHDFTHVDANKNILSKSFDKAHGSRKAFPPLHRMPYMADVHGFSMMVNRSLLEVALPFPKVALGHDSILGCLASEIGVVGFIPAQLADYRKHDNNTSTSVSFARRTFQELFIEGKITELPSNLSAAFEGARNNLAQKQACVRSYVETYWDLIPPKHRYFLERFSRLDELNPIDRKVALCQQPSLSWKSKLIAALVL